MTEIRTENAGSTAVKIYGRTYHLRGEGDPVYLTRLAALVDERMHEVSESTGTADTLKVAILAALNLADEFLQGGGEVTRQESRDTEIRLGQIVTMLDEALAGWSSQECSGK